MDGVHWRFNSEEGLILGETIDVRHSPAGNHTHTEYIRIMSNAIRHDDSSLRTKGIGTTAYR